MNRRKESNVNMPLLPEIINEICAISFGIPRYSTVNTAKSLVNNRRIIYENIGFCACVLWEYMHFKSLQRQEHQH